MVRSPILRQAQDERGTSSTIQLRETLGIRKEFYYRTLDFVKIHPVWALLISSVYALVLNIIASFIYQQITK